jgi:NAD(P)H dehydrogenase (quinone)
MKVLVLFYSLYGHVFSLAKAIAEGVKKENVKVDLKRVEETLSDEIIEKLGAKKHQEKMKNIPIATLEDLVEADAIIFGTPTRFGNMCAQMRTFLDSTGSLWVNGSLVNKVGAVFTSSNSQHGGQESTILSFYPNLLHHGMIIVGLPYTFSDQLSHNKIAGCSPYGASTICGPKGELSPNDVELNGAMFLGSHVAQITKKLKGIK